MLYFDFPSKSWRYHYLDPALLAAHPHKNRVMWVNRVWSLTRKINLISQYSQGPPTFGIYATGHFLVWQFNTAARLI
jgi:hypothetical protein